MSNNKTPILITLMMATSMAAIDSSIVNVSLPSMRRDFGVQLNQIEWVITAYMISFSVFIPLTNWLKKRFGYYHLFLGAIVIFTIGSFLCSIASSLEMLVVSRVIQAIGGGSLSPTSLAILSQSYPPKERGSAIGWWGMGNVMGPALGPTLGGTLTHYLGWESVFYINIPIGILTIWMAFKHLRFLKKEPDRSERLDAGGFVSFSVFIVALQYTISSISEQGLGSINFITGFVIVSVSGFFFVRSSRGPQPLLDLSVFRSRQFNTAASITIIRSLALFGGMFFLPFLLQGLMGYSEMESGLLMLPNALIMLATRPSTGKLADKGMIRYISMFGIAIISSSFFLFARMDIDTSISTIIIAMILRGLGMSLLVAPVSTALLNSVSSAQTQTATAMNSLFMQLGGSIGVAGSAVVHNLMYDRYLSEGLEAQLAEHHALQISFLITAFFILLALIPASRLPQRAPFLYKLRKRLRKKKGHIAPEERSEA